MCTPTICQVAVTRTLVDGGAGLSMLSVETFNLLCIPRERLQPSRSFLGVGGGSSDSLGQIRLPVTFGTYDNFRTEMVDFDIAPIGLPYNAILGYPALCPGHGRHAPDVQPHEDAREQRYPHRARRHRGRPASTQAHLQDGGIGAAHRPGAP